MSRQVGKAEKRVAGRKAGADSTELANLRNNLLLKSKNMSLSEWTGYCKALVTKLEKVGTLKNNQIKGSLAEIVLERYLLEMQKVMKSCGLESTIISNLGIVHRSESNDVLYSAEIDLCLVTPFRAYLFEVKSYTGEKTLSGKGVLQGRTKADIFKQSETHLDFFEMLFDDCRIKYTNGRKGLEAPYKLIFFEFSSSLVKDLRDVKWQNVMPYLNTDTFFKWFQSELIGKTKEQWDLEKVNKRFKTLNENRDLIMQYHISRLSGGRKR